MKLRLLNDIHTLKSTDNATKIEMSVIDDEEEVVDLSLYNSIGIAIGYQGTRYSSETPEIAEDNKSFNFVLSHALPSGQYSVEVTLTKEDGTYHIAPNEGVFILTIEKSLIDVGTTVTLISVQQLLNDMAEVRKLSEQSSLSINQALSTINGVIENTNIINTKSNETLEMVNDALNSLDDVKVKANSADLNANEALDKAKVASENSTNALNNSTQAIVTSSEAKQVAEQVRADFDQLTTGNTDAEVIVARGTFSTLRNRLDDTDEKISKLATNQTVDEKDTVILNNAKSYVDEKILSIPSTDLSNYSTTAEIDAKDNIILQSAKEYTDNHVPQIDTTNLATKQFVDSLSNDLAAYKGQKVSDGELHGLRVTNGKLEFFDGTNWLTLKIETAEILDDTSNSPGATTLIAGTMEAGYFGTVSSDRFITGDALASSIGLSAGISQYSNTEWLKFSYTGSILFVSKKPIRYNLSWNDINTVGAVTGAKTITVLGLTFKVRLFKGAVTNPASNASGNGAMYSEWNRLMLPIHAQAADKSWTYQYVESDVPNWGIGFTDQDLLTLSSFGNGSYNWCQESWSGGSNYRIVRGYNGVSTSNIATYNSVANGYGWRPVLELVQ